MARRDCSFKSFIGLPRFTELFVTSNKLRPGGEVVKSGTTRSCGVDFQDHNIVSNRQNFSNLRTNEPRAIWTVFPRLLRRFAAGYPQGLHTGIHSESAVYPRFFSMICT